MLSSQEQRIWDDVQRFWSMEAEEPPRPASLAQSRTTGASWDQADLPVAVVAGTWITVTLILFGSVDAGLTVGVATALWWVLRYKWPQLCGQGAPGSSPDRGTDTTPRRPSDKRWNVT